MQAIKALVIGLGILIVAGIALLAYAFYSRMANPEFKLMKAERQQQAASRASQRAEGFGQASLGLPEGCGVVEMQPDGKWLYLRIGPAGPCERIVIVDPTSGRVHGSLNVRP
ncbi:MAG TPA: hypothetical protein VLR47_04320 [Rhodospirillales bacterium]|nr:hypothetical protein [Rhodospirillales bacterium]